MSPNPNDNTSPSPSGGKQAHIRSHPPQRRQSSIDEHADFTSLPSRATKRRQSTISEKERWGAITLTPMYCGVAAMVYGEQLDVGLSIHDGTYSIDFSIERMEIKDSSPRELADMIKGYVMIQLDKFASDHHAKFVGAGISEGAKHHCPKIAEILWTQRDIVPFILHVHTMTSEAGQGETTYSPPTCEEELLVSVDEQADSAVRKAIMYFGPNHNPRLSIGFRNQVEVDANFTIELQADLEQFQNSVRPTTWKAVQKYAAELKSKKIKIAILNSTPQGGGVALMRHAMIRFFHHLGVDAKWYVPKPNPAVFRTTKNNHNILQGVNDPSVRFTQEQQDQFTHWIEYNANRYWLSPGGPLAKGGADVIFIDDPQMPGLIPMIKKARPDVPVVYRSHIEIRSELVGVQNSAAAEVWGYLWDRIKQADIFLSHPVATFIPADVPRERVGLMGAATDWLDGLSKKLRDWDLRYYHHNFRNMCTELRMARLTYPAREYIVQVARFDPSKGIPSVVDSYARLRKKLDNVMPLAKIPQLLICGHGAIDDPDASIIYDQTIEIIERPEYSQYAPDIVVMRIPPSDQLLNSLLSCAKIALQLSTREGFEVKVSEALHKGIPIIATKAGGIPLQVQHGKNGYLVDIGDSAAVARHLFELLTDEPTYKRMSDYAKVSVSDEVGTVGNSLNFMYLAAKLAGGEKLQPNGRWIHDMLREDAGVPWEEGEPRLPRALNVKQAQQS